MDPLPMDGDQATGQQENPDGCLYTFHTDVGEAFVQDLMSTRSEKLRKMSWSCDDLFTTERKRQALAETAAVVKGYSDEVVQRWSSEIDTYLVYAGLFSAILTAFNVESYQLLQPTSPDPTSVVLQHISLQLSSLTFNPPFINSSHPALYAADVNTTDSSVVPEWAIWLNALWFSSLVLSLSSASVGILVKQWLNQYQSGLSGDSAHIARLRQLRLNNLEACRVGGIVMTIPVLLQAALAMFFAGLLVLLWNLHRTVATVASLFISAIIIFIAGTTIAPLVTARCAYLSPQSLALYALLSHLTYFVRKSCHRIKAFMVATAAQPEYDTPRQSWSGREHSTINHVGMWAVLDVDMFGKAYTATLDNKTILDATISMVDWSPELVLKWLQRLQAVDDSHFGSPRDHFDWDNHKLGAVFWTHVMLCATQVDATDEHNHTLHWERAASQFARYLPGVLLSFQPSEIGDGSCFTPIEWVLTSALALSAQKYEPFDQHPASAAEATWEQFSEIEDACLRFVALLTVNDISLGNELRDSSCFAIALACRRLQNSQYSPDRPCEHLGKYLHAQAHLLAALAISGNALSHLTDPGDAQNAAVDPLHQVAQDALSDLSNALYHLALHLDSPSPPSLDRNLVEQELLNPVSRIVRMLTIYLPTFRPLLPPGFNANLEAFLNALERSKSIEGIVNISLCPWYLIWTTTVFYDTARQLITSLRNQDPSGEAPVHRPPESKSQRRDNSLVGASTPHLCASEALP